MGREFCAECHGTGKPIIEEPTSIEILDTGYCDCEEGNRLRDRDRW